MPALKIARFRRLLSVRYQSLALSTQNKREIRPSLKTWFSSPSVSKPQPQPRSVSASHHLPSSSIALASSLRHPPPLPRRAVRSTTPSSPISPLLTPPPPRLPAVPRALKSVKDISYHLRLRTKSSDPNLRTRSPARRRRQQQVSPADPQERRAAGPPCPTRQLSSLKKS